MQSFKALAFEQRRKTGGTKGAMEGTSNLYAKIFKVDVTGAYQQNCSGSHSATVLGVFERVQATKWCFRLALESISKTSSVAEHIMQAAKLQRSLVSTRKQHVTIAYCHECENHQKTSWHMPGQFENVFLECRELLEKEMPSVVVTGKPVTDLIGAFEIYFKPFDGGAEHLLYSALRQHGWLPTPELLLNKVQSAVLGLHWNHPLSGTEPEDENENLGQSSLIRFLIKDAVTGMTVRGAAIHIFCADHFNDIMYANKAITELREFVRSDQMSVVTSTDSTSSSKARNTKNAVVFTSARGRCETLLQEGSTFIAHVEAPGYYPHQVGMFKWSPASNVMHDHSSKQRGTMRTMNLMPRIERVSVSIVDLETSEAIKASGLETVLINRRTGAKYTTQTNKKGMSFLHIPRSIYRIEVTAPLFDKIPYALTSDKKAMSFIETATGFDKARREAARKVNEIKIDVTGPMSCNFGIPSMRWPWHFTVVDGATGLRLRGAKLGVFDVEGGKNFSLVTSKDGTAFGMIELGKLDTLKVDMPAEKSDTVYLPFQCSLRNIQRKNSPLLVTVILCPRPPKGCARAILCWNHRCWNDFHMNIKSGDANSNFHVWRLEPSSGGATHDLISTTGQGPSSIFFKLLPNATYSFQVVQYGSFQANKDTMYKLDRCELELLVFNHDGIILHAKYPKNIIKNMAAVSWTTIPELSTDSSCKLSAKR